jgi:hypothetical protein
MDKPPNCNVSRAERGLNAIKHAFCVLFMKMLLHPPAERELLEAPIINLARRGGRLAMAREENKRITLSDLIL